MLRYTLEAILRLLCSETKLILNFLSSDEDITLAKKPNILKNLPSRQLSLWKQRARAKMQERDRTTGQMYEVVNNEDSDDGSELDETKQPMKKGKFEQTEPLSVRIVKMRNRR